MGRAPIVHLRLYPDDCDAYGHVNQAAFLRLFERSRWEALAAGPGNDVFTRADSWPAIRHASVEYYAPAFAGEQLAFDVSLTHLGRTSMSLYQRARREKDGVLVATAYFVAVCIDQEGNPVPVPAALREFFGVRPSLPAGPPRPAVVREASLTIEMAGDGGAVLFIHGFPFDRTMWRHQVAGLTGLRRVAPDLRGFGLSDPVPAHWSLADQADDLAALLEALSIESATVCGLSMGGYVAFELLRRHRKKVRALVLANTRAEADSAEARKQRDSTIDSVRKHGTEVLVRSMAPKVLAPHTAESRPEVAEHVRTMIADTAPGGILAALAAMRDRADSTDLLAGIDVPTLIIGGTDDAVIPVAEQREMHRRIPGSGLVIVEGAGHMTPLEQPAVFNQALAAFLRRLV